LEQTHAELTDILKHSADAIIGVDPDGVVRIWNDGAERLLGRPAEAAIGSPIESVFKPSGERARRELSALKRELEDDNAVVNFATEGLASDGTPIQISLTQTTITGVDGRPLGSSLIVRDTRLQSRLEDQMRRSERLAAISVMAAGLAHEINNPLAVVANRIECMQRDLHDGDQRVNASLPGDLDVLQQHVARLRELTQGLLRFARDDYGEEQPIAMDELGKTVAMLLRRTMAARRIRLVFSVEAGLPPVMGNEKAIETVLVNLLLNAADATPPEGTVALTIRRRGSDGGVEIEVRDTGPGIPPALRERVFEPFFTSKKPGEGTGLGLTVCRTIIDRHGGSIRVDSPSDGGCRFVVTIPLQPVEATWLAHAYS
ncbi:MAG TPA: ATP-binding protein, partial [Gemmatimonadaceae bacterium]|nr:ATP-binding protein [Gemmatimonadaceae bacterium]